MEAEEEEEFLNDDLPLLEEVAPVVVVVVEEEEALPKRERCNETAEVAKERATSLMITKEPSLLPILASRTCRASCDFPHPLRPLMRTGTWQRRKCSIQYPARMDESSATMKRRGAGIEIGILLFELFD